jgi:hypothetical protein
MSSGVGIVVVVVGMGHSPKVSDSWPGTGLPVSPSKWPERALAEIVMEWAFPFAQWQMVTFGAGAPNAALGARMSRTGRKRRMRISSLSLGREGGERRKPPSPGQSGHYTQALHWPATNAPDGTSSTSKDQGAEVVVGWSAVTPMPIWS